MDIFTKAGAIDALERAVRTFAQTWLVLLATVQGGLLHVPWTDSLGVAGLAAVVSVLTYVVAAPKAAGPGLRLLMPLVMPPNAAPVVPGAVPIEGDTK